MSTIQQTSIRGSGLPSSDIHHVSLASLLIRALRFSITFLSLTLLPHLLPAPTTLLPFPRITQPQSLQLPQEFPVLQLTLLNTLSSIVAISCGLHSLESPLALLFSKNLASRSQCVK
jgi:hypothetical protein